MYLTSVYRFATLGVAETAGEVRRGAEEGVDGAEAGRGDVEDEDGGAEARGLLRELLQDLLVHGRDKTVGGSATPILGKLDELASGQQANLAERIRQRQKIQA